VGNKCDVSLGFYPVAVRFHNHEYDDTQEPRAEERCRNGSESRCLGADLIPMEEKDIR
jgi:hypothetical protein